MCAAKLQKQEDRRCRINSMKETLQKWRCLSKHKSYLAFILRFAKYTYAQENKDDN
jgi:hypothetical protein